MLNREREGGRSGRRRRSGRAGLGWAEPRTNPLFFSPLSGCICRSRPPPLPPHFVMQRSFWGKKYISTKSGEAACVTFFVASTCWSSPAGCFCQFYSSSLMIFFSENGILKGGGGGGVKIVKAIFTFIIAELSTDQKETDETTANKQLLFE